ncbi:hypothetical protein [Streptomyces sp. KS_5]|nr:hypothetical protein [Streptomyces sp. KS_5]SED39865.1 hypothetical protein SAMN05428938_4803 [Streptomyces sp. KS_5]
MAEEEPPGRRNNRTWNQRLALALPWFSLLIAIQQMVDWVLPHV